MNFIGGSNCSNCESDADQINKERIDPKVYLTTSIVVGIQYKDGIIIGVDTRAILDTCKRQSTNKVFNNVNKIFKLHENVFCGGIGRFFHLTKAASFISGNLGLHYSRTNRRIRVATAKELLKAFKLEEKLMANFVVGGVDNTGIHLYTIYIDGTTEKVLFNAMGAGQLSAMSIFEDRWKPKLNENQARRLMLDAIRAATRHLPTVFDVDYCIIRNDFSVEHCSQRFNKHLEEVQNTGIIPENLPCDWRENIIFNEPIVEMLQLPMPAPYFVTDQEPGPSGSFSGVLLRKSVASTRLQLKRSNVAEDDSPRKKSKR